METKKEITELEIISKYMDKVLMYGKNPDSIYQFSKEIGIEESDFYKFFSSFEHIESQIFTHFYKNTVQLLEKNEEFHEFSAKDKLLSFYFTFFENLTANRSYVLFALDSDQSKLKSLKKLNGLKSEFLQFVNSLEIDTLDLKQETLQKLQNKGFEKAFWIQLLLSLKFWMSDTSPSFEKTDLFIEKSVHASFDLINTQPIKSIIDFGKFILKEKMDFKL
jgi:hypothetical protein